MTSANNVPRLLSQTNDYIAIPILFTTNEGMKIEDKNNGVSFSMRQNYTNGNKTKFTYILCTQIAVFAT